MRKIIKTFLIKLIDLIFSKNRKIIVKRKKIKYELDLSKVIDFSIFFSTWERDTDLFIKKFVNKNFIVLEIGSNIGAHTFKIANRILPKGMIYAFEPTKYAFKKLQRNKELNPDLKNVKLINKFVGSNVNVIKNIEIKSNWARDKSSKPELIENIESITLDEFYLDNSLDKIDILKIDVDGFDYEVIKGSKNLIKNFKPLILIELCEYELNKNNHKVIDIFNFLKKFGYKPYDTEKYEELEYSTVMDTIKYDSSINSIFSIKELKG